MLQLKRLRHNNWTIHSRGTALQGNETAAERMAEAIENAARRASDLETEMISCHRYHLGFARLECGYKKACEG